MHEQNTTDYSMSNKLDSSFNGIGRKYYLNNFNSKLLNYKTFLNNTKPHLSELINSQGGEIKYNLKLEATYHNPKILDSDENRTFKTSAKELFLANDINEEIEKDYGELVNYWRIKL